MTYTDNDKTKYSGVVWRHPECVEAVELVLSQAETISQELVS